jgi:predicted O-methyltransferase YrrM
MKTDPVSYAESFIAEDEVLQRARERGVELGVRDTSPGTGNYLKYLAHLISAQSVVEAGTGSGVGTLWVLRGMLPGGLLTSIDNEIEHSRIAKLALSDEGIAPSQYRLITNPIVDVMSKLADRAYDLVILRHDPEDLTYTVEDAHRILRSGGVLVIDSFFGGGKVPDPTQRDAKSIALRETGKMIKASSELWVSSLINVGDGLLLATKL